MSTLDDALKTLALPHVGDDRAGHVHEAILRSVRVIEDLCRRNGAVPAGMPGRSARAFSMLKWLTGMENFARYREQVDLARGPLESASRFLRPGSGLPARVLFTPGRHLWKVRHCAHAHHWDLGAGFLGAGREDLDDLGRIAADRQGASPDVLSRHRAFIDSPDFAAPYQELDLLLDGETHRPRGRVIDLDDLFDRVNAEMFQGTCARPHLHWRTCPSRVHGLYDPVRDVVVLSHALDDPEVPEYVAGYVLYHELLHKRHGFIRAGARRLHHTPEFLEDERRFPRREEAERWLATLGGSGSTSRRRPTC